MSYLTMPEGVTKKESRLPGPTVALLGGIHGNETVGIDALRWARDTIMPERGTIYFIEGNLAAITQGVRFVEENLNRCFQRTSSNSLEARRARELMPILDVCDAALDLHASNSEDATPFVVCEEDGFAFARTLRFPIVSTGWDALEPGATDGYLYRRGKLGVTLECGSVHHPEATRALTQESVHRFLCHTGILSADAPLHPGTPRLIHVHTVAHQGEEPIVFSRAYSDFEALAPGEVFARAGANVHIAAEGDCIIFPRANAPEGAEVYLLGKEIPFGK